MPPPPEAEYPSKDEALQAVHSFTKKYGYELVLAKAKKNKAGSTYRHQLECKRHSKLSNTRRLEDDERVRTKRSSIRTGTYIVR